MRRIRTRRRSCWPSEVEECVQRRVRGDGPKHTGLDSPCELTGGLLLWHPGATNSTRLPTQLEGDIRASHAQPNRNREAQPTSGSDKNGLYRNASHLHPSHRHPTARHIAARHGSRASIVSRLLLARRSVRWVEGVRSQDPSATVSSHQRLWLQRAATRLDTVGEGSWLRTPYRAGRTRRVAAFFFDLRFFFLTGPSAAGLAARQFCGGGFSWSSKRKREGMHSTRWPCFERCRA